MSETLKPGDRVRARSITVHEGVVRSGDRGLYLIDTDGGVPYYVDARTFTIEILERAKPVWQDGDVAMYEEVGPRYRFNGKWYDFDHDLQTTKDSTADMYYTLILRDGKRVNPFV